MLALCVHRLDLHRHTRLLAFLSRSRQVFFIRHGESRWNEAQAKRDVLQMVSHVDHPLNEQGFRQARAPRKCPPPCAPFR